MSHLSSYFLRSLDYSSYENIIVHSPLILISQKPPHLINESSTIWGAEGGPTDPKTLNPKLTAPLFWHLVVLRRGRLQLSCGVSHNDHNEDKSILEPTIGLLIVGDHHLALGSSIGQV